MKKGRVICFLLAGAVCFGVLAAYLVGWLNGLESKTVDLRFAWRGARLPDPRVVVVDIDEKSISELGRWPWPRDVHARLVEKLTEAGAKVIAFDVLFTEADKDRPQSDLQLGRAARKSGRGVFGMLFHNDTETGLPTKPLTPVPEIGREGVQLGSVNIFAELDGVNRKLPVMMEYDGQMHPSLAFASYALFMEKDPAELYLESPLPVEGPWNEININFAGGFKSFPYYSFIDVLKGRDPATPDVFKDKIVLVGGTAAALFDYVAIPGVPNFPGLEMHANALDNFLNGRYLHRVSPLWTVLLVVFFCVVCGFFFSRTSVWGGAFFVLALMGGYAWVCERLFISRNSLMDMVAPLSAVAGSYVLILFYRFLTEEREKRWIKGTFSQYLSPKVIEVITQDPSKLKLGGEERVMSVFFSDLAGFTSISEALKPKELVTVLNEYLTDMSDIILKNDGVVDKYIGDAIMAFWNAPVDQPRHAYLACFAALEQMKALVEMRRRFLERNLPLVECRIGINTGPMVVGNMGSKNRFDYTVMGDSVNLASRLEGANKPFHTNIMISEFTYERVKDEVEARELDLLRVKGKAIPIRVYELVSAKGELKPDQRAGFALYNEAMAYYRDKKFREALEKFRKVQESLPHDGPSEVYAERCEGFLASPPPKDWDGVFVMTTK